MACTTVEVKDSHGGRICRLPGAAGQSAQFGQESRGTAAAVEAIRGLTILSGRARSNHQLKLPPWHRNNEASLVVFFTDFLMDSGSNDHRLPHRSLDGAEMSHRCGNRK